MPRVPFAAAFNIGTDIVHLLRIHKLISKGGGRNLTPFAQKILHPLELRDLTERYPSWQDGRSTDQPYHDAIARWLGGRFAAKEAARKALGATTLGWKDVRVEIKDSTGQSQIVCAMRNEEDEIVEHEARLSISHDGDYVVATVLAAEPQQAAPERSHPER
jgi:holo-[acyl-carrier protein] synthase